MTQVSFNDLKLIDPLKKALAAQKYTEPTPIQAKAIPDVLKGHDLLGAAQTGTGKTAAFALPTLQRLYESKKPRNKKRTRCLALTPTRELAVQVAESFQRYGANLNFKFATVFGGVHQNPQVRALSNGVDVLIATPGRLMDLMKQGHIRLDEVEVLILDEADRMLDMGFVRDVRKIMSKLPEQRQTLFFSATMPKEVTRLADDILSNPKMVQVNPVSSTAELIDDHVMFVQRGAKRPLLAEVLSDESVKRAIVFTRTKHRANRLAQELNEKNMTAEAIHGNKSQNARQKALKAFSAGKVKILVATDIVARGIDVDGVSHVVNFELPNESESYVHRIGRTARAGTAGVAISFCDREESMYLHGIEKMLKRKINVIDDHAHHAEEIAEGHLKGILKTVPARGGGGGGRGRGSKGRRGKPGGGRSGGGKAGSGRPGRRSGGKPGGKSGGKPKGASNGASNPRGKRKKSPSSRSRSA